MLDAAIIPKYTLRRNMNLKKKKKQIIDDLTKFINGYQSSIWANEYRKVPEQMIPIITIQDLIYKFGWGCTLHEFKQFVAEKGNEDLKAIVQDFVSNNFIHYACSTKMKELLQEYKESNVAQKDIFNFDVSQITTFNSLGLSLDKAVSLNCDLASDIDGEVKDKVLSTVERFDDDKDKQE